jgi:hypothetical protein
VFGPAGALVGRLASNAIDHTLLAIYRERAHASALGQKRSSRISNASSASYQEGTYVGEVRLEEEKPSRELPKKTKFDGIGEQCQVGLTDFLYQRDREITALARPDPAVAGTG